jgi:hypothetical protein
LSTLAIRGRAFFLLPVCNCAATHCAIHSPASELSTGAGALVGTDSVVGSPPRDVFVLTPREPYAARLQPFRTIARRLVVRRACVLGRKTRASDAE